MVVVTVQAYVEARVHTIEVENKKLFWVKMIDVQKGLELKNICDLARKEICGIFETKNFTEEQNKKYIRTESEMIGNKIVPIEKHNKTLLVKKYIKTVSIKENISLDSCKPSVAASVLFLLVSLIITGAFVYFHVNSHSKRKLQDYY